MGLGIAFANAKQVASRGGVREELYEQTETSELLACVYVKGRYINDQISGDTDE